MCVAESVPFTIGDEVSCRENMKRTLVRNRDIFDCEHLVFRLIDGDMKTAN